MKAIFYSVLSFIVFSSVGFSQESKNSLQLIQSSLKDGRITEDEALDLRFRLLEGTELPEVYRSNVPVKCGLPIVGERMDYLKNQPEKRKAFQKTSMQSVYTHNFNNKNGQQKAFRINYDASGPNAVPSLDANSNTIPDWVEETGLAFEHSYRLEVDTLGYREPLPFGAFGYYEIFILDLNSLYGATYPIEPSVTSNPDTYNSYIEIENDFVENFYTHGYDALRVTCGHEFFHAIQFSYNLRWSDAWYYELSATWMEDVTYDDVNDYYAYLPGYFNSPNISLDQTDGYSAAHWNHMIDKKYGRDCIKKSWEYMISRSALTSIDDAIKSTSNSNLSYNFSEFAIWNYYTAGRADSITYYPEAAHYPKIKLLANRALVDTSITGTIPSLAANYYSFVASDTTGCRLRFQSSESNSYYDLYTIEYNKATAKNFFFNYGSSATITINDLLPGDTLTCVTVNAEKNDFLNYSLRVIVDLNGITPEPISNFLLYPSPFVLGTADEKMNFKLVLGKTTELEFRVFSIDGKMMRKINFGTLEAGPYDGNYGLYWDGRDSRGNHVPSGVYIYQLTGKDFKKTGKIAVVR